MLNQVIERIIREKHPWNFMNHSNPGYVQLVPETESANSVT
jgi:hypothetical protein